MPLPLEIATTQHAHDAQISEVIDLLCKPNICGPASDVLGQETYIEAVADLPRRLCLGECAAALARYTDKHSDTTKPVGTIIYSRDSNDPKIVNLELIAVREKYRLRQVGKQLMEIVEEEARLRSATQLQVQVPQKMPGLQDFLAKNGFYFSRLGKSESGVLVLRYKKDLRETDSQQKTGLPPESL